MKRIITFFLALSVFSYLTCTCFGGFTYAEEAKTQITGTVYVFNSDSSYDFLNALTSSSSSLTSPLGSMMISGNIVDITDKNGISAYKIGGGTASLYYVYGSELLDASKDEWHLTDDDGKKVNSIKLDSKIKKGALILQTSTDGENWVDAYNETNVFKTTPNQTESFYDAKDIQLTNGTYYRLIVAYKLAKRKDTKKWVVRDDYDVKKHVEVYEFYLYNESAEKTNNSGSVNKTNLGEVQKKKLNSDYSEDEVMTSSDPHYGWSIGEFYIKGYSERVQEDENSFIFLKNVGDQLELYFTLQQDINKLNGNDKLVIAEDKNASDATMQVEKQNFKRGTLIIQETDYENVKHDPVVYTNYLEANTSLNADTKVELFEEGDYEVILDYSIKDSRGKVSITDIGVKNYDYQIKFKFSVRNGNCMVFPLDASTNSELENSSIAPNGFYLDYAKSRYLTLNIQRETLNQAGTEFDTRFNRPAKEGEVYKDEGLYTITITNKYTHQTTKKKIYVGDDLKMIALMKSGLTLDDINKQLSEGMVINDEGEIVASEKEEVVTETVTPTEETTSQEEVVATEKAEEQSDGVEIHSKTENSITVTTTEKKQSNTWFYIACLAVTAVALVFYVVNTKKKDDGE